MKLGILIPVCTDVWDPIVYDNARPNLPPEIELEVRHLDHGVDNIESDLDMALNAPHIIDKARQMEKDGLDAVLLFCFKDPMLGACKELLNIPVVGLQQAAVAVAGLLGENIAVVATSEHAAAGYRRALAGRIKQVVTMDIPVLELVDLNRMEQSLRSCIEQALRLQCDAVILGCGSIMGLDFAAMQREYGVPIVVPIHAALSVCYCLIKQGLRQSRIAYPEPEIKAVY